MTMFLSYFSILPALFFKKYAPADIPINNIKIIPIVLKSVKGTGIGAGAGVVGGGVVIAGVVGGGGVVGGVAISSSTGFSSI